MTLDEIADRIRMGVARKPLDRSISFDCAEDGVLRIEGDTVEASDTPSDCTIRMTRENLARLVMGKLNPMTAFATGKLKVSGDATVALKLGQLL